MMTHPVIEQLGSDRLSWAEDDLDFGDSLVVKTGPHGYSHGWVKDNISADVHDIVQKKITSFRADNGMILERSPVTAGVEDANLDRLRRKMRSKADKDRWDNDKGVQFTKFAMDSSGQVPGTRVFVAQTQPDKKWPYIAGAISMYEYEGEGLHVDYLGTTGITDGTGTALARQAAKIAAEKGLSVIGEPESEGALEFWKKLGWHEDPDGIGTQAWGWTAEEAKIIASIGPVA